MPEGSSDSMEYAVVLQRLPSMPKFDEFQDQYRRVGLLKVAASKGWFSGARIGRFFIT